MIISIPIAPVSMLRHELEQSMDPKTPLKARRAAFNRLRKVLVTLKLIPMEHKVDTLGLCITASGEVSLVAIAEPKSVQIPTLSVGVKP